jgi:F420-non-reducing hydrogenase small subunit
LREKSKLLIAFGSCSYRGGISALSNLYTKSDHLKSIYINNPSIENPNSLLPEKETEVFEGKVYLPPFFNRVETLSQTVDVDYRVPGCPPESHQIWNIFNKMIKGISLPPKGSMIGGDKSLVCNECKRKKKGEKIKRIYRTYEIVPDKEKCLLEQGIICFGLITRAGCGALCPKVNTPCTGCYGPLRDRFDQGAKAITILLSKFDKSDTIELTEENTINQIDDILYNSDSIPDFIGTFYKYGLGLSQDIVNRLST